MSVIFQVTREHLLASLVHQIVWHIKKPKSCYSVLFLLQSMSTNFGFLDVVSLEFGLCNVSKVNFSASAKTFRSRLLPTGIQWALVLRCAIAHRKMGSPLRWALGSKYSITHRSNFFYNLLFRLPR